MGGQHYNLAVGKGHCGMMRGTRTIGINLKVLLFYLAEMLH